MKLRYFFVLLCLLATIATRAQLKIADTATMLSPYLHKTDTLSISNRITAVNAKGLQSVTDIDSTSTTAITTTGLNAASLNISNVGTNSYSIAGIYMTNQNAILNNKYIVQFIQNTLAGGGGVSHYFIRHNNYDGTNNYYNILAYTLSDTLSAMILAAPESIGLNTGDSNRVFIAKNGWVGINTQQPKQLLHVSGNTAIEAGSLAVRVATPNQSTLQVEGAGHIVNSLMIGGAGYAGDAQNRLWVNGSIRTKHITVSVQNWGDYVFKDGYQLRTLPELEQYIKKNSHLPDMPSANTIEAEGLDAGEILKMQQVKIEELTLYMIALKKKQEAQEKEIADLISASHKRSY